MLGVLGAAHVSEFTQVALQRSCDVAVEPV
jgi:hypothetical protein